VKRYAQRGFSLLELLVALFVVVIITSLASLGVNSGGSDIELDARVRSLADISGYAVDEAQMRGVSMGLLVEQKNDGADDYFEYGWWENSAEGWRRPAVDEDIYGDQRFPPGLEVELELEDLPVATGAVDSIEAAEEGETIQPQVMFYASGEVTPGALNILSIETGDLLWRVEWDLLGRFVLKRKGEESEEDVDEDRFTR
jgi:general secretion pathway protein H